MAKLFNGSMNLLWSNGVTYEYVFLFFTDTASYVVKAGSVITAFFPNHLISRSFHRILETIRRIRPEAGLLIATTVKKKRLKAPSRVLKFKEIVPPECIIT